VQTLLSFNDGTRDLVHLVCCRLYDQLRLLSRQNNSSDPAVKQILLSMNEKSSFIIEDLDDHHLVIKADEEYRVRRELEVEVHPGLLCGLLFQND
jgi:TFIIH basal transcription factor complex TTD-A subunit